MKQYWVSIMIFCLGWFSMLNAQAQTVSYTQGNFNIQVTPVHPCNGSDNGAIQFRIMASDGGSARLVFVGTDFPDEVINVGSTYTWTDPDLATEAGTYEFIIRENIPAGPGRDVINTLVTSAVDGVVLVALADITINPVTVSNNTNCVSPDGQVIVSLSGGSKSPALSVAGSFDYTWTTNNGLSGFPLSGTFDGIGNMNLATLLGRTGFPAGTYTLQVFDNFSDCSEIQGFTITDPSPNSFTTVTTTPNVCLGSGGTVTLSGSEGAAVNYQIYLNGNPTAINQNGTGGSLNFTIPAAILSAPGAYNFTIRAVNNLCTPAFMAGTAVINVLALPTTANAGPDQTVLCGVTSTNLAANVPVVGTGAWNIVSGAGGSFANSASPTSSFSGTAGATYTLRWTISNAPCAPSTDDVIITFNQNPTTAAAGPDQPAICGVTSTNLAANTPTVGTGAWTIVSGAGGSLANAASPTSSLSGTVGTTYVLRWTISNAPCTASFDDVSITFNPNPTTANAGPDQLALCGISSTPLAGNAPTIGTGSWSIVSGSGGSFVNAASPTTSFNGALGTTYTLRWTITNAPCPPSTDDVVITFNQLPTPANAGPDQTGLCVTTTSLAANTPTVGTGAWTIVSGAGGSFVNAASPTSSFSGTGGTTYTLRWTISNAPCTPSTDDVVITFNNPPTTSNAGPDQLSLCGVASTSLAANTPSIGTGAWTIVSGVGGSFGNVTSPTSSFSGSIGSTYTLRWTISNAPCAPSTDDVVITFNQSPTTSNAGPDQNTLCGVTSTVLAANTPTVGTGAWTVVSGTGGSFGNASIPTSSFTGTAGTTYTLRWTISNSTCTPSTDDVVVTFNQLPTTAVSGIDQTSLCGVTTTTLAANTPTIGTGAWSIVSGVGGSFVDATSPTTSFNGTAGTTYTLRWTISNAPCTSSTDDVVITFNQNPTTANAGTDQLTLCGVTTTSLTANTPTVGIGSWTIIAGAGGSFVNNASPTTLFTGIVGTSYTLRWTITNAPCVASADDVVITFNQNPTAANAGPDQLSLCGVTSANLAANTPVIGSGAWTVIAGVGGSFGNALSATSSFSGVAGTSYTLRWTITNAPCTASADDVTITFNELPTTANAGADQLAICGVVTTALTANTPTVGLGAWTIVSGAGGSFANTANPLTNFSGVVGTTYVLRWTISNAPCIASSDDVSIRFNQTPSLAFTKTDATTCAPGNEGTINITPSGGTGPYQFSIDGGGSFQASGLFNGLTAGSYNALVQDAVGCQSAITVISVASPSGLSATVNSVNVTCNAGSDGSITINATGGSGAYTYSIDNGGTFQASNSFTGLAATTYDIIVRDGAGCQFATSVTLNEPSIVSFTTSSTNINCNGGADGSITVTPAGGNGVYTFSNTGGVSFQGSNVFNGLGPATYNIQVRDVNNCVSAIVPVIITEPTVVTFTTTIANATTCVPGNEGSISITASGGAGGYEYSIDNGATFQPSNVFAGLTAASYTVLVRDGNGCLSASGVATVNAPGSVSFTSLVTNVDCNGSATGSIAVTASGGSGTYTYSNDNGATFQASNLFSGLVAAAYQVRVRDSNGCLSPISSITVTQPSPISFTPTVINASACGINDGVIAVAPSGGISQYRISINNGVTFTAPVNSFTFTGLAAGNYQVVVRDANNCTTTATSVNVTAPGSLGFTSGNQNVTCAGSTDGSITITATGGSGTYTYSINGGTTFQASNIFSGLAAATYNVVVDDGSGCTFNGSITITQPAVISVATTASNLTCNGSADGAINITASGGTGALQYSINNGVSFQASPSFTGLAANSYAVVVRDVNNCSSSATSVILSEPTAITFTPSSTNPTACGTPDGSVAFVPTGGTAPYFASLDGGTTFTGPAANFNFTSLAAGLYPIVVRDANNCLSVTNNVTLTAPGGLSASFASVDVLCFGAATGSITITATGGNGVYDYSLNGGAFQSSNTFAGLTAAAYTVVARDGLGCTFNGSVIINESAQVTFSTVVNDITCNGLTNGVINITAAGGNSLYSYSINNGGTFQASNSFTGLAVGSYQVLVRDVNSCSSTMTTVSISEPAALSFTVISSDPTTCTPGNDGSITVSPVGGTSPFQFSRDGGTVYQALNAFTGLVAGSYNIVVRDANLCTTSATTVTLNSPTLPDASFSGLQPTYCVGTGNVALTPLVGGGTFTGPGISGSTFSPATAGVGTHTIQYSLTVSGCTNLTTQLVTVNTGTVDASFTGLNFVYCANAAVATLSPATSGGTFTGPGMSGNTFNPATAGAGQHTIQYSVTVSGCTGTSSVIVTVLAANDPLCTGTVGIGTCAGVVITPKPSPATCTNSDGRIVFSIKPFVPLVNNTGVRISISGVSITNLSIARTNFNDSTFLALPVGTYNYSIEYGDPSCIKTGQVTIDQSGTIGTPVASNIINPTCAGASTGSVVIDVPGETGNTLEWSIDGITWTPFICGAAITGLPQGPAPSFQHLISVRRNASDPCNGGVLVVIQDAATPIDFTQTMVDATCVNNDGSIQIGTISGGTAPYSFIFQGIALATLPAANTFTALPAGDYSFIVVDANNCTESRTITVGFPGIVDITPIVLDPDCSGNGLNGAITVTINSVGTFDVGLSTDPLVPPAAFQTVTSGGGAIVNFSNRSKGTYYITARSAASLCPVTETVTLNAGPTAIDFTASATDILCFNQPGILRLEKIVGEAGFDFGYEILSGGVAAQSGTITALAALTPVEIAITNRGEYQVRLFQSQLACTSPIFSANFPFTVSGPDATLDTLSVVRTISFPDQATGTMNIVIVESGREPYEFKLELTDPLFNEQSMPAIDWTEMSRSSQTLKIEREVSGLYAGVHTLSIRDAFGCERSYLITIGLNTELFIPNIFTPNGDNANEEFYIRNLPEGSKLVITDRWGKNVYSSNNYQNDWTGGTAPDGVYYYKVIIAGEALTGWVEILRGQ